MQKAPRPKITIHELANAIKVLKKLQRQIDHETERQITRSARWFLQNERAELITKEAMQQTQAVLLVIRRLIIWYAVIVPDPGDSK